MFIKFILYRPLLKKCLYDKHARYSLAMCGFKGWNLCGCAIFFGEWNISFHSMAFFFRQKTIFLKRYRVIFKKNVLLSKKGHLKHFFCEWFFSFKWNAMHFRRKTQGLFWKKQLTTGSLLYALYFKNNIVVLFFFLIDIFIKHISSNRCMFRYRIIHQAAVIRLNHKNSIVAEYETQLVAE